MPASKLARNIVLCESPIGKTNYFLKAMKERTDAILEGIRRQVAESILLEAPNSSYEDRLDNAIDYVMRRINESGINVLPESIERGSRLLRVKSEDLRAIFETAVNYDREDNLQEKVNHDEFQAKFVDKLNQIVENNAGNILAFLDTTSAYVTPMEAKSLVEVYSQLSNNNKHKMIDKLVSSRREYNKLIEFAAQNLREG
jgi:hypothetical protein